jgi:putative transposase
MKLTERHIVNKSSKEFKSLDQICFLSKNLYNSCLYRIKNEFNSTGKWIRYNQLEKEFRNSKQQDYIALPNNSSQQIMMLLDTNLKSYFSALKAFKKSKTSFTGCPKFPNYKDRVNGRNIMVFTCVQFRFKDSYIYFPKKSGINPIKTKLNKDTKIHQVRIIPRNDNYVIEVVYNFNEKIIENINNNWLSIDLGLNNLAACISNKEECKPFIINGKPLKSINQYYNKKKSQYQSKLGYYVNNNGEKKQTSKSKRINILTNKRNNKINDYLHKSSKLIIKYCEENAIDNIVLGKTNGWKQEINLGKRTNQNFVDIPFNRFESYLSYKCQKSGINFSCREESYTSIASALDLDKIPTYNKNTDNNYIFSGKRIYRGLYESSEGTLINSDINGSINILRKEIGDEWIKPILPNRGLVVSPLMVVPL